ncbi:hypothetical protein EDF36_1067 [Rathayibacter sp. PhB152]|nr:hypothetical protein EDF36_1067 [Rathayibacter sp. PhB152]
MWGGGSSPLIPADSDGQFNPAYSALIPGAEVDNIVGWENDRYDDYSSKRAKFLPEREHDFTTKPFFAAIKYGRAKKYATVVDPVLKEEDPWCGIYKAALGIFPEDFEKAELEDAGYRSDLKLGDFLRVSRPSLAGSFEDLIERLQGKQGEVYPRITTMFGLSYGSQPSTSLRSGSSFIPSPWEKARDAGPNVVVLCSDNSTEDLALLWNLRAAWGNSYAAPIGIPLSEYSPTYIAKLVAKHGIALSGFPIHPVYITSASLSAERLEELAASAGNCGVMSHEEALSFGPAPGIYSEEPVVWNKGRMDYIPKRETVRKALPSNADRFSSLVVTVRVPEVPFPSGADLRKHALNGDFFAGGLTQSFSMRDFAPIRFEWPSPALTLKSVGKMRGLDLAESEPGRIASVFLSALNDIWEVQYIAHAPLLKTLEMMASRTGMSWAKKRLRESNIASQDEGPMIAPDVDDLPEVRFEAFKKALGNNAKAAENWVSWAERRGLIVRGFQLRCEFCHAKQWIPVAGFAPPIVCRGCSLQMLAPFGVSSNVSFHYRLSESLRRVYEVDAMGHILALRYFEGLFGALARRNRMITGSHPGIDVKLTGTENILGESDLTILFENGDLIPMEIKRSYSGMTDPEVEKLSAIADEFRSPWMALIVADHGRNAPPEFVDRGIRGGPSRHCVVLSYDQILDPQPFVSLGGDPFRWIPLSQEELDTREKTFVRHLVESPPLSDWSWLESDLMRAATSTEVD